MGVRSFLYGYIEEAWPGAKSNGSREHLQLLVDNARAIERHNDAVLSMLPLEDTWPPLSKHMFGCAPSDAPMINYKTRPIHFAASLKEVDWELRDWLDKFEGLLRNLYWEKAAVHCHAAYLGQHLFIWRPTHRWVTLLTDGIIEPIVEWDFESSMEISKLNGLRHNT